MSNFNEKQLETLLSSARIKPAANQVSEWSYRKLITLKWLFYVQIYLHPYNYQQQSPTLEYAAKHDIVIEAYGALTYENRFLNFI